MNIVLLVFRTNLKRSLKDKKKFFINLLLPIVVILLSIVISNSSAVSINVALINDFHDKNTENLISLLKSTKGINIKEANKENINTDILNGKYAASITVKKPIDKQVLGDVDGYFTIYTSQEANIVVVAKNLIKGTIATNKPISFKDINKSLTEGQLSKAENVVSLLSTVLLIMAVVNGALLIKDKEDNILFRYKSSPNKRWQYIIGNVLFNYCLCYVQLSLTFILATILQINMNISLMNLLLFGLVIVLVTTSFGTFIACLFKKDLYANMFSSAIGFILALVGGGFLPYEKMPTVLQVISNITPIRWMIKGTGFIENGSDRIISSLIVLLVFAVIFSSLATIFSKRSVSLQ